jgi:hypothetical protein
MGVVKRTSNLQLVLLLLPAVALALTLGIFITGLVKAARGDAAAGRPGATLPAGPPSAADANQGPSKP